MNAIMILFVLYLYVSEALQYAQYIHYNKFYVSYIRTIFYNLSFGTNIFIIESPQDRLMLQQFLLLLNSLIVISYFKIHPFQSPL